MWKERELSVLELQKLEFDACVVATIVAVADFAVVALQWVSKYVFWH